jgi:hypothetical protein
VPDDACDFLLLLRRKSNKLESGANVGSVPDDGYGSKRVTTQSELNSDRFSDIHRPLHHSSQTASPEIEADTVHAPYTAAAQMTERNWDAEQNSGMLAEDLMRTRRLDSRVRSDRHGRILLALMVHARAVAGGRGRPDEWGHGF